MIALACVSAVTAASASIQVVVVSAAAVAAVAVVVVVVEMSDNATVAAGTMTALRQHMQPHVISVCHPGSFAV